MKEIFLAISFIFFVAIGYAQNEKALDDKNGFREAKFEMPLKSFKDMVELNEKGVYKSTSENLRLGSYTLESVHYFFYKDQLSSIIIETKGYSNSTGVLKILQEAYGNGRKDNEYIEKYIWSGARVALVYDQNSITNDATIIMWSLKLSELERTEEKQQNTKAVNEL